MQSPVSALIPQLQKLLCQASPRTSAGHGRDHTGQGTWRAGQTPGKEREDAKRQVQGPHFESDFCCLDFWVEDSSLKTLPSSLVDTCPACRSGRPQVGQPPN